VLQAACTSNATQRSRGDGVAVFAGDHDPILTIRPCPHLVRSTLAHNIPTRIDRRLPDLLVLPCHRLDRRQRHGHDQRRRSSDGAPRPERRVAAAPRERRSATMLSRASSRRERKRMGRPVARCGSAALSSSAHDRDDLLHARRVRWITSTLVSEACNHCGIPAESPASRRRPAG